MSTKCRVCHRPLKNPAHVAAGIGPDCAATVARRQAAHELARAAAYPAERLARIERNVRRLAAMMADQQRWSPEAYSLILHWYGRWRMVQIAAQRKAALAQPSAFRWDERPRGAQPIVREAW